MYIKNIKKIRLISAVLCSLMFFSIFTANVSADGNCRGGEGSGVIAKGIDISRWQGSINWSKLKETGISFVIIKAGSKEKDPYFEEHYAGAKSVGLNVGCYIRTYAGSVAEAKDDANNVLSWISGKQFEYPVYYDIEETFQTELGKNTVTNMCMEFCDTMAANGYYPGVYSSSYWFNNYMNVDTIGAKYDLWLARWTYDTDSASDFSKDYGLWQYSDSGHLDGISEVVDLDVALKNYPKIIRSASLNGYSSPAYNYSSDPNHYPVPTRTLYAASPIQSGNDVMWAQAALSYIGYKTNIDGYYGYNTAQSVAEFQKNFGLTQNGEINAETRSLILSQVEEKDAKITQQPDAFCKTAVPFAKSGVDFGWNTCKNANSYTIHITYPNGSSVLTSTSETSYSTTFSEAGVYKIFITANGKYNNVAGKAIYFAVNPQNSLLGDINSDGSLNLADCNYLQLSLTGKKDLSLAQTKLADLNSDKKISLRDLYCLLKLISYQ